MKIEEQNLDNTQKPQLNIPDVRRSYCTCGDKWSTDTNRRPPEDLSVVCNHCGGYVTVNQVPNDMRFTERFGNQL